MIGISEYKFITRQTDLQLKTYDIDVLLECKDALIKGFDFETTDVDHFKLHPIMLGIIADGVKYIIDFTTYDPVYVGIYIDEICSGTWVAHNAQFDATILKHHLLVDIDKMTFWCTMVASQVLYNGSDLNNGYADIVRFHFQVEINKDVRQGFINRDLGLPLTWEEVDYLGHDLHYLPMLHEKYVKLLGDKDMLNLMLEIENPLIPVLVNMHLTGVTLNVKKWEKNARVFMKEESELVEELKERILKAAPNYDFSDIIKSKARKDKEKAQKEAGVLSLFGDNEGYSNTKIVDKFNPASNEQIKSILNKMGLRLVSTTEDVLQKILLDEEEGELRDIVDNVLRLRKKQKLVSTYGMKFLKYLNPTTGRIHSSLAQATTDTGRLNSKKPNVQNIPAEEDMRDCFEPDSPDHILVTCDFDGQELRIATAYSGDEVLLKSFHEGLDLHSYLAQGSFRLIKRDPEFIVSKKVNPDLRNLHKRCLFGHIYGAGGARHAEVLNVTRQKGGLVSKWLRKATPGLTKYQDRIKHDVLEHGRVSDGTRFNRRKLFRWRKANKMLDHEIEKQGANFPIQGTAATMSKEAMIRCHQHILKHNLHMGGGCIKLAIHDELVFQLHVKDFYHGLLLKEIMEEVGTSYLKGLVPMKSSMKVSRSWRK